MNNNNSRNSVLGIDPGTNATGFGIVERCGNGLKAKLFGVIRSRPKTPLADRLLMIFSELTSIIQAEKPSFCAIETVFNAKNPRSSLVLGHARGVSMLAARNQGLDLFEYSPLEVKKAVVGYGRAEKCQVQDMVRVILGIRERVPQDAADALAVAICHLNSCNYSAF